jgi:uncharacterized OB-fold protein
MTQQSPYLSAIVMEPIPDPLGLDAPFWAATRDERLTVQQCVSCGNRQWSPEWTCHRCHSFQLEFVEVAPSGRIYSWQRVWHASDPALAASCPYIIVVVSLDDAPALRMVGNLLGEPTAEVLIGCPVTAQFEHHREFTLVQWAVAESF